MQGRAGVLRILAGTKTAWAAASPPMDTEPWPWSLGSGLPRPPPPPARTGHGGAEGMKGASVGHMSALTGLTPRDSQTLGQEAPCSPGPHPDLLCAFRHPPPDDPPSLAWVPSSHAGSGIPCGDKFRELAL